MDAHEEAVRAVSARIQSFSATKRPFRIYHGSTNSTRGSQRSADSTVDTSALDRVLSIDTAAKTAIVEPNVPMDALVEATLAAGLVPLVVMEFPGITVGGGFSGTSGESSSFRHGPFDGTVNWIEIVLASGEVVRASRHSGANTDLFWGAASAFGTLGVVTLLEVQLREAQPYVKVSYSLHGSVDDAVARLQKESADDAVDYVDGITFSKQSTVVCSGQMTGHLPAGTTPRRFTRMQDPWFYVHVQRLLKQKLPAAAASGEDDTLVDYIPITDYLFRYDRGGFWAAKYSYHYFLVPFNSITRFMLDPFMHTRTMYRALHKSGMADFFMIQDVGIPYDRASEFVDWLDTTLNIYPLWLCPLELARRTPNAQHGLHSDFALLATNGTAAGTSPASMVLNFGVWGPASFDRQECIRQNRLLEQKVHGLGGKKWLYAHAYYTEDEFWAHYDRASYDRVRAKYGATWLPSVYDKVKVNMDVTPAKDWWPWLVALFWSLWPLRGLYGVLMTIVGGDYLLSRPKAQVVKVSRDRA